MGSIIFITLAIVLMLAGGGIYLNRTQTSKYQALENHPGQGISTKSGTNEQTTTEASGSTGTGDTSIQFYEVPGSLDLFLEIYEPKEGSKLSSKNVNVKGKTLANAEISINELDIKADSKGNFSTWVSLEEGDDEIFISANDNDGNYIEKTVFVEVIDSL